MKTIIGIDPGFNGGICILNEKGKILNKYVMPIKEVKGKRELDSQKIKEILENAKPVKILGIEKQQSIYNINTSIVFKMGRGMGILEGLAIGLEIPYILILSRQWQKEMFGGLGKGDTKQQSRKLATKLFPNEDFIATKRSRILHDGMTDSTLIAEFTRTQIKNKELQIKNKERINKIHKLLYEL